MFLANQSISFLLKNYLQKYRLTFCVFVAFLAGVAGEEKGDFEVWRLNLTLKLNL